MKQDHIEPHQKDTPIPDVSDKDVEMLVFRNLEARQKAWEEDLEGGGVILQYPVTRTFFQRLAAWWIYPRASTLPKPPVNRSGQGTGRHQSIFETSGKGHWRNRRDGQRRPALRT